MRIEQLVLERYGIFTDRLLSFRQDAALHVIFGANEAGKTSALSAITDLLFGFGGRTDYDFRYDSKNLRIGGSLRHSDGRIIAARRRKGNKNTLVDENDQPLPDDFLAPFLNDISREIFVQEFGLTAESLRQGGQNLLEAGGRLAETLAAGSAGLTALSRLKQQLQSEAENLFVQRKSPNKPFYLAAERRDAADKAFRDATVTRDALKQLEVGLEEAKLQIETLSAAHAESGSAVALWQRALRVRSKLATIKLVDTNLAKLSDLPAVSAQLLAEWRIALEGDNSLGREIASLDVTAAAEAAETESLAVDETLLAEGTSIDALREHLGAVRKAMEDLPRRRQARDDAEKALSDAARRLGLSSHTDLLTRQPTDLALAYARELIEQTKRANQTLTEGQARYARAQQELADLASEESRAHAFVDAEQVKQRFDALGDIPAQADRVRRDAAALRIAIEGLESHVASLDPSAGALHELKALPMPDHGTIAKFSQAVELSEAEVKRLVAAASDGEGAMREVEAELVRLSSAGAVPTRADLVNARRQRDTHFGDLRDALSDELPVRQNKFADVLRSSQDVDGVTDLLLTDTERATRQEGAKQRLEELRRDREHTTAKLTDQQAKLSELNAAWIEKWAASGLVPRSPAEMLRWRERVEDILGRLSKLDDQKESIDTNVAALESGKMAVIAFLKSVGRIPDSALAPEILFREAKSRFEELQAAWSDAKALVVEKRRTERDLSEAQSALNEARSAIVKCGDAWPNAMAGISCELASTPAQAEAALTVWQSVPITAASHEREGRSVTTMEADLRAFDEDVSSVIERVAAELKSEPAESSLISLSAKLAEMRRAKDAYERLREAARKRSIARNALVAKRAATAETLADACRIFGLEDLTALVEPINRLSARFELESERQILQRELYEISDGRDEAVLRDESAGLDLDSLPGEIEREALRHNQLLKDISEASANHRQKETDLAALLKGKDAVAAVTEKVEAGAELLSIAETWLLRAAASRLASFAIERHRAMVQNPLVSRASSLFAMATGGAFEGLGVDYGDDDESTLVACRTNGERVKISGLSEGTRDQLFLTLRLALLERRTSEPMPFLGDDLLTSFDDTRTLAMLRLLAAASQQRQIILFTHHKHVADLAGSLQDHPVDVIGL